MSLPERGPWIVTATSSSVDWPVAAAALAATAGGPAAVVLVTGAGADLLQAHVASFVEARDPSLADLVEVVRALARTHIRVLVIAVDGLVVPVGPDGWTAADLAAELHAPVAVVTGTGADAVGQTILILEALDNRRIPASVIAVGEGGDFSALPVRLAGQLPADAMEHIDRLAEWIHPLTGTAPPVKPDLSTRIGKKAAVGVAVAFVLALFVLFLCNGTAGPLTNSVRSRPSLDRPSVYVPPPPRPRRSAAQVCPTNSPGASAAAADPAAAARVDAAWARIERWLAAKAPASYRSLRPPAPPERIAATQARMSVAFPPDLVASLRRHDGADATGAFTLPPYYRPMSLDQIVADWTISCQVMADVSTGPEWWHKSFVPFADGDGVNLVVDQRPGSHGRVGDFDPEQGTRFERWPASVAELLEGVASSLETGTPYAGSYRPTVTAAGELDWEILRR